MIRKLYTFNEVIKLIEEKRFLVLSGDEKMLDKLPLGNWIGGTIPYFINTQGQIQTDGMIFVDDQTKVGTNYKISTYTTKNVENIATESFENGFSVIAIPFASDAHVYFSLNSLDFPNIFLNPIIGFITGVNISDIGKKSAKIYNGQTAEKFEEGVVALHVQLPPEKIARLEIVNIFSQQKNADQITFPKDGFVQKYCFVNGKKQNFVTYLKQVQHDLRFPIITNQTGALINKSFREINEENNEVEFYAPIFKDEIYKLANKLDDYKTEFSNAISEIPETKYACYCLLNLIHGDLEMNKIRTTGASTFGEIAFQVLNQTMVYLIVENKDI